MPLSAFRDRIESDREANSKRFAAFKAATGEIRRAAGSAPAASSSSCRRRSLLLAGGGLALVARNRATASRGAELGEQVATIALAACGS